MIGRIFGVAVAGVVGLVLLSSVFGSWYTIDQGERGVVLRNGAISYVADPALHFKLPFVDSVERIDVREQVQRWICVDADHCQGSDLGLMQAYSKDQQPAELRVSVNYSVPVDKVAEVYAEYGSVDNLVARALSRKAPQAVKEVFGSFNAATAVSERARFSQEALVALQNMLKDDPIIVTALQIENIDYSTAYETAVEDRMLAEVEVAKRNQQLQTEKINAEIAVTQAQGRADSVKAEADALAYATRVQGEATADAIRLRGGALRDSPDLIDLTRVEKWNGVLPVTVLPNDTIPFLDVAPSVVAPPSVQ